MSKPVIIILDDEKIVVDSLMAQIKNAFGRAFVIETTTDVEEAMELLDDLYESGAEVKLIISDWLMPKKKGTEFLIDVYKKYPKIAQIMLSGFADPDSIRRARNMANLKAYLTKPWDEIELINTIEKVFAGHDIAITS